MVSFNLAYTAPVNPSGASPVLTEAQLWTGLARKVRHGDQFVPAIEKCDVTKESEDGGEIERKVVFKEGYGPKGDVWERCVLKEPARVDFFQKDGSLIANIISDGPSGDPSDLFMTYSFEWIKPSIQKGTPDYEKELAGFKKTAKMAVESTIKTIRELVTSGEI